jgi:hypothetical protein
MSKTLIEEKQQEIDEMLQMINIPSNGRFTKGKYNILRLIAAFPLGVNLNSKSMAIRKALEEDDHQLACLRGTVLTSALVMLPYGISIINSIKNILKRARGEPVDNERSD